jgi:hypothetical protein
MVPAGCHCPVDVDVAEPVVDVGRKHCRQEKDYARRRQTRQPGDEQTDAQDELRPAREVDRRPGPRDQRRNNLDESPRTHKVRRSCGKKQQSHQPLADATAGRRRGHRPQQNRVLTASHQNLAEAAPSTPRHYRTLEKLERERWNAPSSSPTRLLPGRLLPSAQERRSPLLLSLPPGPALARVEVPRGEPLAFTSGEAMLPGGRRGAALRTEVARATFVVLQ